jgi:hypothetical protein
MPQSALAQWRFSSNPDYADPNRRTGKRATAALIDSTRRGVPVGPEETAQLGRICGAAVSTSLPSSTTTPPKRTHRSEPTEL